MTGRFGTAVLGTGLVAAVASTLLWLRVALLGVPARPARVATGATLAAAGAAVVALEVALIGHDFGVRYVAENGARDVPLYFTVTSLWAALDGSLLLWLVILAGCALLLALRRDERAGLLRPWAMAVIGAVTVFFFALTFFAANPFTTVDPAPADGPGPNPLLRDHAAMGLHPPVLYAGYIGLVVPFGYALAALLAGRADRVSVAVLRRWTLVAWSLLTAGIVLGAWWSYAVLGWGGYWAWDPVENASLLPWLTATALLHTLLARRVAPGATGLSAWSVALAGSTFLLVLLGTFLTRSGAVASVHAFTASPLGPMLLGFVLLAAAAVLGLAVWRSGAFRSAAPGGPLLARDSALLGNAVLMVVLTAVVLTGTLFPLLAQAVRGSRAAVGPGYFNRAALPVALVVLLLMALAPFLRPDRAPDARALRLPAAAGLGTAAVVGLLSRPGLTALAAFALAASVLAGLIQSTVAKAAAAKPRAAAAKAAVAEAAAGKAAVATAAVTTAAVATAAAGNAGVANDAVATAGAEATGAWRRGARRLLASAGLLAHAGFAILAVGAAASSVYTVASERQVTVGQEVHAGGVTVRLLGVERGARGGGMVARLRLAVAGGGTMEPSLRYYPARDMTVSVPAIRSGPARDVYATVLGAAEDGTGATVRLAVNPLVGLVWLGGATAAAGGLLAAAGRVVARRRGVRPARVDRRPAAVGSA
ncbi:cytochrome c-type biogenesis CcmF C-terminal domain-containing protein [Rhizomonospora bruguierae]|uniref:cytochrome c-type biogenesis CcmF C-terminal domain-containing protein n=1 Tax=Rhizomonospora bruguierae TaxID=1581705 RepID=UPI001BCFA9E4|nr:cytochrome c-type biogenesis CcmF C-terminal domain-containing protein [Micromonospora sp. NBRC 107566]